MLFFTEIDRDQVPAGIPAIDQTVGENGSRPGFAAEDLSAGCEFEAFGRDGRDHQFPARGEGDDLSIGDDDSAGAEIGLSPNLFAGFDFDALELSLVGGVAIDAVEMARGTAPLSCGKDAILQIASGSVSALAAV